MEVAGLAQIGSLLEGGVAGGVVVAFVGVAAAGAAHHDKTAAGLFHHADELGVAGVGRQTGIPAHLHLGFHQGVAQLLGMFQRHIEAVVDEKYLLQAVAGGDLGHLLHHLVDGPDHPPGALGGAHVVGRGGVVEPAQLGEHADTESRLGIPGHIKVVKTGPAAEIRRAAHAVVHDFAVFTVEDAGHSPVVGLADFDAVGEFGEGLAGVSGDAEVGLHEIENLLRHDAESRSAADDGGVGNRPDALDDAPGDGQLPLWVNVAVIAEVADRDTHHLGLEVEDGAFDFIEIVLVGKHEVDQLHLVPGAVQMSGYVGQANGNGLRSHPAHDPVVTVGGNQQDTHRKSPSRQQDKRQQLGRLYTSAQEGAIAGERGSRSNAHSHGCTG